ncbi:hypothetical protein ABZ470_39140 [Streptosporangium sp. NPDC020072]|uniref:hypothetical protein n=1 Tax=Streptosporangium sp. NPDC020072 TaxID=3154788 RepID=UPI00342D0B26
MIAAQRVLAPTNWQKIADGRTAHDVRPEAIADANHAFTQLRHTTGDVAEEPMTVHHPS